MAKVGDEYKQDRAAWANQFITKGLTAFEEIVSQTRGKYCVGDDVTFADCLLIPQAFASARFNVEISQFKNIKEIVDNLTQLPEFKAAHATAQPDAEA